MVRWLALVLAIGCSSESGQRVVYLEADGSPDGGGGDECAEVGQIDCHSHELGEECWIAAECAPLGQLFPGGQAPPVECVSGRCTFACSAAGLPEACQDIGGSCNDWRFPDGGAAGKHCTR